MSDDNRIRCADCCLASIGKKRCMELDEHVDLELPRRCIYFVPNGGDDLRNGRERFPNLQADIEKSRAENQAFFAAAKRGKKGAHATD